VTPVTIWNNLPMLFSLKIDHRASAAYTIAASRLSLLRFRRSRTKASLPMRQMAPHKMKEDLMKRYLLNMSSRVMILLLALSPSHVVYSQSHLIKRGRPSLSNNRQLIALDQKASTTQEATTPMVQWQDYAGVLNELSQSALRLTQKLGKKNQQLGALIEQMNKHSDFLFDQWQGACCEATPATYLESLEQNVSLLKSVLNDQIPESEISPILQIVEQDLGIKAAHCKRSAKGWDAVVVVSVNARKGNEKVDGLEVWFAPKGWVKVQSKWKRFAKVTCGTSEKLAPGVYMIWIKGLEPVPIDIGGSGVDTKEVDLLVP
jgi:hypothetical protein